MQAVLPLLLERAEGERDGEGVSLRQAAQALQQALATLGQLERFREDYLRRSPVAAGQALDAQRLVDWQRFVSRLDQAIALQRQEITIRTHQEAQARQRLVQAQQRLMSLQALGQRWARQQQARMDRRLQAEADAFAARATRADLFGFGEAR